MAVTKRALIAAILGLWWITAAAVGGAALFRFGPERSLGTVGGPYAVAGEPHAWAMAWIEGDHVLSTLWLTTFGDSQTDGKRPIAGGIDTEAGILLDHDATGSAVAWRAGGSWNIAHVPGVTATDREPRRWTIETAGTPLAVATRPDGTMVVAIAEPGPPSTLRLVAIDPASGSEHSIQDEAGLPAAAALAVDDGRIALTWIEAETSAVRFLETDDAGRSLRAPTRNLFPAARTGLRVGYRDSVARPVWVEETPAGREARADGHAIVAVPAEAERPARIVALDEDGTVACRSDLDGFAHVLGDARHALVFRENAVSDDRVEVRVRSATCGDEEPTDGSAGGSAPAPTATGTATPPSHFGALPDLTDPREGTGETTLGGSSEPCDGRDNDGNGQIDEGCDGTCDSIRRLPGYPSRVTNDAERSRDASIVWTGTEYAVVWEDGRPTDGFDIYFARFDRNGNKIGSEISVTPYHAFKVAYNPSLVWTGTQYGLVWRDNRDGTSEIFFETLRRDGSVDDGPIQLTFKTAYLSDDPVIAWSGTEFGIAWEDNRDGGNDIYFKRLDANGNAQTGDLRITTSGGSNPEIVRTGSEWALAWVGNSGTYSDIYFARLNDFGTKITGDIRVTTAPYHSSWPSLAWTGSEFGIAYAENRGAHLEVYLARLSATGGILTRDHQVTNHTQNASTYPSLVWTGTEYGVGHRAYRTGGEARVVRVRADGTRIGTDSAVLSTNSTDVVAPDLVWNGYEFGLAFHWDLDGNYEIYLNRHGCCDDLDGDGHSECQDDPNDLDPNSFPGAPERCDGVDNNGDGTVDESCDGTCPSSDNRPEDPDVRLSVQDANVSEPSIAAGDGVFASAWVEGFCTVKFRLVDRLGAPLAPERTLASCSGTGGSYDIEIVWTGSGYGVLYSGAIGTRFVRTDPDGNVLSETAVDSPGADFELIWNGAEYAAIGNSLSFLRIDHLGNQIGEPSTIPLGGGYGDLVWNGDGYGLVYSRNYRGPYFRRLDRYGLPIGNEVQVANSYNYPYVVVTSITWDGTGYAVAWDDITSWDVDDSVRFRRLDANGTPIGTEVSIGNGFGHSTAPSLAWTGEQYGLAWQDDSSGLDWIYLYRIDANGNFSGPDIDAMRPISTDARGPELAWDGEAYGMVARYRHVATSGEPDGEYETWFQSFRCCGRNEDSDGYGICADCDDDDDRVYPGAAQVCDGVNNDCNDPNWPQVPADETDNDNDSWAVCGGDCDDDNAGVFPGAFQLCNGRNDDCDDPNWPDVPPDEIDDDGDGYRECGGDCDDTAASVHPFATQVCDGVNNDCNDLNWPAVPADEVDDDGDAVAECGGDCDDTLASVHPGAAQLCDGLNNDCDDPNWPTVPANEADDDLDNVRVCDNDCNDADASVWATPGEVLDLRIGADKSTLSWNAPAEPGTTTVLYDTLRSDHADDFLGRGICIEVDDGSDTEASDTDRPFPTQTYYYLIRAENDCPDGEGSLGTETGGTERLGRSCP